MTRRQGRGRGSGDGSGPAGGSPRATSDIPLRQTDEISRTFFPANLNCITRRIWCSEDLHIIFQGFSFHFSPCSAFFPDRDEIVSQPGMYYPFRSHFGAIYPVLYIAVVPPAGGGAAAPELRLLIGELSLHGRRRTQRTTRAPQPGGRRDPEPGSPGRRSTPIIYIQPWNSAYTLTFGVNGQIRANFSSVCVCVCRGGWGSQSEVGEATRRSPWRRVHQGAGDITQSAGRRRQRRI